MLSFSSRRVRPAKASGFSKNDVTECLARNLKNFHYIKIVFNCVQSTVKLAKMPHCMVPKCTNGWKKTKGSDITYHRVPSGPTKSIWLRNIRRDNPRKLNNSFVCSVHFTPDCFIPATEICGRKKPKMLKPTAIPTLFEYTRKKLPPRSSSLRQIREREVLNVYKTL
jgi:hypothetical protein